MTGENRNVGGAVAQRRDEERNDVEAIEKILAETAVQNFLFEIFVGGGNDANIDADGLIGADRLEALPSRTRRTLDWVRRLISPISSRKVCRRRAWGEFADFIVAGAGEAALDVAEEFGFDELFGDGGAVDFDEGAFIAQAGACSERATSSLPVPLSPKLARGVGGSGDSDLLAQSFHGNAVADDLMAVAELGAQRLVFLFQAALLHGVADQYDNFFEGERLFDEVEGAEFCCADAVSMVAWPEDHDYGGRVGMVWMRERARGRPCRGARRRVERRRGRRGCTVRGAFGESAASTSFYSTSGSPAWTASSSFAHPDHAHRPP